MSDKNKVDADFKHIPEIDGDLMQNHEYDGIRELNNPAPAWWQYTFYATIIFSIIYLPYYHLMGGQKIEQEFAQDYKAREQVLVQNKASNSVDVDQLVKLTKDAGAIAKGKEVYAGKCAVCHGPNGGGLVGPNLTDDGWIHGDGTLPSIYNVVDAGVAEKGMPPWGPVLSKEELMNVSAFVRTLRGAKADNPKAQEGKVFDNEGKPRT